MQSSKSYKHIYPHKNLHMNIHSSLIHDSQKVEKIQVSISMNG